MTQRYFCCLLAVGFLIGCGKSPSTTDAGISPPATWWTETSCNLPACDAQGESVPFNSSGNFTITLTTKTTDCNQTIQNLDDRLKPGNVHTGQSHPLSLAGTCDYATDSDAGMVQDGTYYGHTLVTCEVTERLQGVIEVDVSNIQYTNDGNGSGTATAYFSNWPVDVGQTDNKCQADYDVTVQRAN